MNLKRKMVRSCLLVGVGTCIIALILIAYLVFRTFKVDRNDCSDVLRGFALSLVLNRSEAAKSLVAADQWNRIDTWTSQRQGVLCSFSLDPDNSQAHWICEQCSYKGVSSICCEYGSTCAYKGEFYHFSIDNAILQKSEAGCLIVDWDEICESGIEGKSERCD